MKIFRKVGRHCYRRIKEEYLYQKLGYIYNLWENRVTVVDMLNIRDQVISYTYRMNIDQSVKYKYSESQNTPVLYASTYAALLLHLVGHLEQLPKVEKQEWLDFISQHQDDDGLYKDEKIINDLVYSEDWWGWRHLTLHVIMTITALGGIVRKPFAFLTPYLNLDFLTSWLNGKDWEKRAAFVSNEVQNIGVLLQYSRDFHANEKAGRAVDCLLNWLDTNQDPRTGYWGEVGDTANSRSLGVQTGYHLWLLFFYDQRPLRYIEQIIDSVLATQNKLGGFGVAPNSSACEDIDSIDPLVRLSLITDYRREDISNALKRVLPWVLLNMNDDGGFVFRRSEKFLYGHELMSSGVNESAMFPTWFRTLSLAYLAQALPDSVVGHLNWGFIDCPGLQFFTRPKSY